MKFNLAKGISPVFIIFILLLFSLPVFSEEEKNPSPSETIIQHYREILTKSTDPVKNADAHFEIGLALEKLGRKTEATAEYLKVIINYPEVKEINKKAEERLANLYSGFSGSAKDVEDRYKTTEGQKDPTIFFAYIKSLYENYITLGQYDRALHVLEKLYDMDPENAIYLTDIGDIYLEGYNDADKAIFHYKKAIEINPNDPKGYVDLGRGYEKKGDYENAARAYSKSAELSPANPWTMYGLKRIDSMRLAKDKRLIKDWYFLGPFPNTDRKGLENKFPPEEKIDLGATYKGKDNIPIRWFRPFNYEDSGYVDLNKLINPHDYVVAYALTYVYSPSNMDVEFRFGSDSGIRIWINDTEVFVYNVERTAELDDDIITVTLNKGWNKLLLKVSDTWGSWGFFFRATDLRGNPIETLAFDPMKDDRRLREIYTKLKQQKRMKITGILLIYTGALSVFLLGLYFMISNIHNRIKINRMKEDFISSVSHELKTPISAVKMLAETLRRGSVKEDEKKDQYYEMIMRESDRLTRFINKILDFSKIEKGGKVFRFEKTNMVELSETATRIFKDEAQDPDLKITFNADKKELFANADKDAIMQVILNLIDNAYKYSTKGKEITVSARDSEKSVLVSVEDKGLGIPKSDIEKIFNKFYRVDRDIMHGVKGSGLGLAFVKQVIDAHDGKIAVESEIGKGTKFIISLPIERM